MGRLRGTIRVVGKIDGAGCGTTRRSSGSAARRRGRAKKIPLPSSSRFDPPPPRTIPVGEPRASLISRVCISSLHEQHQVMFGGGAGVPAEYARARGVSTLTLMLVRAITAFGASRVFSASVKGVGYGEGRG